MARPARALGDRHRRPADRRDRLRRDQRGRLRLRPEPQLRALRRGGDRTHLAADDAHHHRRGDRSLGRLGALPGQRAARLAVEPQLADGGDHPCRAGGRRAMRRAQRLPGHPAGAAVAGRDDRDAGALPRPGVRDPRRPGGHRLPDQLPEPGAGQLRRHADPQSHDPLRDPGGDLRRDAAPHRGGPVDLRDRRQRRGGALRRPAGQADQVLAVRRLGGGRRAGRHRLHDALRQRARRQRHGPRAVGRRLRPARRRVDLRWPRQPAGRHRRGLPARDDPQRADAQQRVVGRADDRHRRAPAALGPRAEHRLARARRAAPRPSPHYHHRVLRRGQLSRYIAAVGLIAGALAVSACGSTKSNSENDNSAKSTATAQTQSGAPKKGLTIAFLPKQVNNPYFTVSDGGGKQAVTSLGESFKRVGPSDASASSQVSYINTLTTQKVSAIAISANDPNAVVPALKKAMSAGIKVVTYDSDTAPAGRDLFINQASAEDLGRSEVQVLAKQIANKGQIAILSATPNATNQNTWIKFMKDELKKPEYKDVKLVKVAYGNDDDQKSFQEAQGLLQAYPNLKGIISPTTVGIAAAARYLDSSKYKGKVELTGLGTPNQMRKFVKDGTVTGFELWDPGKLGSLAGYAAAALASGKITGEQGDSFDAGDLGTKQVGADHEVVLGPPTVFNKANIDQFHF